MGISFKLTKKGTRYHSEPRAVAAQEGDDGDLGSFGCLRGLSRAGSKREVYSAEVANDVTCMPVSSTCSGGLELPGLEEYDVSFTLNLFQNGYFIGKPTETENLQPLLQDGKSLHPYDRASETLFSAIQSGCLPGDILDDIPSKYINGTLVCEVRDYRKCHSEQGTSSLSADGPVVNKVRLRMTLENVVKDIPLLSDSSWTYSDLMEVEARIVKALQPKLYLDPTPKLDRLCADPCPDKLDLGIRRKRPWQTTEVTVTSNSHTQGKKVCIDGVLENDNCKSGDPGTVLGNAAMQGLPENMEAQHGSSGLPSTGPNNFSQETARPTSQAKFHPAANILGAVHDRGSGSPANFAGASVNISSPQSLMGSYNDTVSGNAALLGKRENRDAQMAALSGLKRLKQTQGGLDGVQHQQLGSQFVGLNAQDTNWKNQLMRPHLDVNGSQYSTVGGQRYLPQTMNNVSNQEARTALYFNQQGTRYGSKEEQTDTEKLDGKDVPQAMARENSALDQQQPRTHHLLQQPSMRNHLPPLTQWQNPRPLVDRDMRKDDILQKRKTLPSPRVSSGPMVQSPVSSKSGEISSGSVGQFSAVATTSALGSHKATTNSNAAVGLPSATSSPNDSVHRQPQVSAAAKRKSNSATKTQAMSGVGSPASVSNMTAPLNASSPSIGTAPMGDQIERFAKIDMVTQRYQLNIKKTKVTEYPAKKAVGSPTQHIADLLNNSYNAEDFRDEMKPMSRSLVGGNINICKIRTMEFMRNECNQAIKHRLVMAEKPFDGTVAMQYGDAENSKFPNTYDCLLILPTTNHADMLAAQLCMLMIKDGYQKTDEQIQTLANQFGSAPSVLTMAPGIASDDAAPEIKHEAAPSPLSNISNQSSNIGMGSPSPSQNLSNSTQMLASRSNVPPLPISQGYFPGAGMPPRAQQLDQPLLQPQQQIQQQQQMQQQQQQLSLPQIQRSSSMLSQNPLSQLMGQSSNLQMNANPMMANKSAAHLQLQMLQQQQQQQNPMQRKVMMGLSAAMGGMGNNNMVGLGGLGNIMGMGGLRPMAGLSGMRPNPMNLGSMSNFGTGIRPGSLSADQAAAMAQQLKQVQHNRMNAGMSGMYGGQAGMVGGIPSSAGLSMLGHAMNRANMSQLQRNAMTSMGPPKIPGPNLYHQQQQLQLQQQQQQPQLQQQQQQQISSPLQQSHVGSPSIVTQQQQQQQQQMSHQTAMSPQLSSGALQQQMNNNLCGNGGPGSPQLSSQTHGSVGSITSSPMDQMQGANKGGGGV